MHQCTQPEHFQTIGRGRGLKPQADGTIYWHIDESKLTRDLPKLKTVIAFEKCFDAWKPHLHPIKLQSTGDATKAAIVLRFMKNGDPDLPSRFGQHTLAYAYMPIGQSLGYHSDIFFNDARKWLEMHEPGGFSLFKVAVHEVGHSLGIRHSTVSNDIMFPTYAANNDVNITLDTIGAIEELFGPLKQDAGGSNLHIVLREIFPTLRSLKKPNRPTLRRLCQLFNIQYSVIDRKEKLARMLFGYLNE